MTPEQKDFLLEAYKASNEAVKEQGNKRNYVLAAYAVIGSFLVKDIAFSSSASVTKELSPLYYLIVFSIISLTAIICLSLLCLYRAYNRKFGMNTREISQIFYGARDYSNSPSLTGISVDNSIAPVKWYASESVVPVGFSLTTFMIEAFIFIFFWISMSETYEYCYANRVVIALAFSFIFFNIIKFILLKKMKENLAKTDNHLNVFSGIV